jgi:hypothetical protein
MPRGEDAGSDQLRPPPLWGVQESAVLQQERGENVDLCMVGSDRRALLLHRVVLAGASSLLADLLRAHPDRSDDDGQVKIIIPDVTHGELQSVVVAAAYTGSCTVLRGRRRGVLELAGRLGLRLEGGDVGGGAGQGDSGNRFNRSEPDGTKRDTGAAITGDPLPGETPGQEPDAVWEPWVVGVQGKPPHIKLSPVKAAGRRVKEQESILKANTGASDFEIMSDHPTSDEADNAPRPARDLPSRFVCTLCGNSFSRRYDLGRHSMLHTGERRFSCTFCDVKFVSSGDLHRHVRRHTGEKPYLCRFGACTKTFIQKGDLNKHMRIHLGQKKYRCGQCSYSCIQGSDLKNHMLVHSETKLFHCEVCNKDFRKKCQLRAHNKKVHRPVV